MRLIEINLSGFGRLVNRRFEFGPGLNLVFGQNEAGKSTLQRAITALLYGFYDDGSITASKREEVTAAKPWNASATYAGSMTYELTDGKQFRVVRVFDPRPSTTLMMLPDERDVTREYRSASHGRLFFADEQLGMPRNVFESVCCVRQAELVALDQSATAITDTLVRLSTSGSADTTTAEAVAILDQTLKDNVGTARSWTKPLARAMEAVAQLEARRTRSIQARNDLLAKLVEANRAEENLRKLEQERQRLEYLRLVSERDDVARQIATFEQIGAEADRYAAEVAKWAQYAAFPVALQPEVASLTAQHSAQQKECQREEQSVVYARQQLEAVRLQIAPIEERLLALSDARNVSNEDLWLVQQIASEWQAANGTEGLTKERWSKTRNELLILEKRLSVENASLLSLAELGEDGIDREREFLAGAQNAVVLAQQALSGAEAEWQRVGMDDAQFRAMETAVQEIQSGARPIPKSSNGCLSIFGRRPEVSTYQTPTQLVVYSEIKPIYTTLLNRRSEAEHARSALTECQTRIRGKLHDLVGDDLDKDLIGLKQRLRAHLELADSVTRQRTTVVAMETELANAHAKTEKWRIDVQNRLATLGFAGSDVRESLATYRRQCARRTQLDTATAERDRLLTKEQLFEDDIKRWEDKCAGLREVEHKLRELLTTSGIDLSQAGLDAALQAFAGMVANRNRWLDAQTRYEAAARNLELAGGAAQRQRMETVIAGLTTQIAALETASSHPLVGQKSARQAQEYASLLRQTDREGIDLRDNHIRLRESIDREAAALEHPAEIDEELAMARSGLRNLEEYGESLELARTELAKAVEEYQRQFAPRLEAQVGESLSQITSGRYSQVSIDPGSLHVSLVSEELHSMFSVGRLSTGTRDLVYLMLRVGLAQMMSIGGERLPLILDDPFVQCDRNRLERALAHIVELAQDNQVFLFTKDEWTRDKLARICDSTQKNRIHVLD